MSDTEKSLCDELDAFCKTHSLEPMSADELLNQLLDEDQEGGLIKSQIAYLEDFIKRWDATMDQE
jgi:hypothetical protein